MTDRVGVGARVKTAKAIVVVLGGGARDPRVLERCELAIRDPEVPESHQPYHAGLELAEPGASEIVAKACAAAWLALAR